MAIEPEQRRPRLPRSSLRDVFAQTQCCALQKLLYCYNAVSLERVCCAKPRAQQDTPIICR